MKSLIRICLVASFTFAANVGSYGQATPGAVGGTNPHPRPIAAASRPDAVGGTNPHPQGIAMGDLFLAVATYLGF